MTKAMCNLIKDKSEDIAEIRWTVTGKVSDVIRTNGSSKPDLHFDYDAMGQRIAKTVTNKNVTTGDKKVTTYYVRDPQGNVLAVYEHKHGDSGNGIFTLAEQHLYGAGRLGMRKRDLALNATNTSEPTPVTHYELTNHLGNVMAVISDKASTTAEPTVVSLSDYYPFGMTEPGRSYDAGYRYGFQGQDRERELWGGEASFFTYRISDNRLGRFFSVDPLSSKFPWNSSYAFSENRVMDGVEMEGLEYISANIIDDYQECGVSVSSNDNGTFNMNFGNGVEYNNVSSVDWNGQTYYNLGEHLYYEEGVWSKTGKEENKMTEWAYTDIQNYKNNMEVFEWGAKVNGAPSYNCATLANAQANAVGTTLRAGVVSLYKGNAIITYDAKNNVQLNVSESIDYINRQLEKGKAVVVGVDYNGRTGTDYLGTDHFVTITGRTSVNGEGKFLFMENATGNKEQVKNFDENRLTPSRTNITGGSVWGDGFTVTRVQVNKE